MSPFELWKSGTPLSEAWYQYSSDNLYLKYRYPRLSKIIDANKGIGWLLKLMPPAESNPNRAKVEKYILKVQHQSELRDFQSEYREKMQFDVIEKLKRGELSAIGYLVERGAIADPIQIPGRFYEMKYFSWDNSKITSPPHEFQDVRIIGAEITNGIQNQPLQLRPQAKLGRPSVKDQVIEAMISLYKKDPVSLQGPYKQVAPLIRGQIHAQHPNDFDQNKPADRTIAKFIPAGRKLLPK